MIRILQSAADDLIQGYTFYENQKVGLGEYFLDSLFADIDSLALYAGSHPIHFDSFYRMLARRFPFAVYYKITASDIIVYAVLDCRRNPAWIRKRL